MQNINLVETLKLVKNLWTEIRHLDGILDGIGDFGRMERDFGQHICSVPTTLLFGAPAPPPISSLWNFTVKLSIRKLESWGYSVVKVA